MVDGVASLGCDGLPEWMQKEPFDIDPKAPAAVVQPTGP
jgi:hypothetical protein